MDINYENVFNDETEPIKIEQLIEGAIVAISRSGFAPKEEVIPYYGHGYPIDVEDVVDREIHFILHLKAVNSPLYYSFKIVAFQKKGTLFGYIIQPYKLNSSNN